MLIFGYWVKQYWQDAAWRHLPEKTLKTVENWLYAQTTHDVGPKLNFAC